MGYGMNTFNAAGLLQVDTTKIAVNVVDMFVVALGAAPAVREYPVVADMTEFKVLSYPSEDISTLVVPVFPAMTFMKEGGVPTFRSSGGGSFSINVVLTAA